MSQVWLSPRARISRCARSPIFVLVHLVAFIGWSMWNALAPAPWRFDPYPYGLLRLIASMEVVLIATFVLIAQHRMRQRSEQRDHLHSQLALLTEQELTLVLRMLRRTSARLDVRSERDEAERAAETRITRDECLPQYSCRDV